MKQLDRILGWVPWIFGALIIAGIVHILSILAMPRLAPNDSYSQLAGAAPLSRLAPLPAIAPGSEFAPFEDPAMLASICRYDLDRGPLRLRGNFGGDQLILLSFHSRFGEVFYSMTDRSATRGVLDILVLTSLQLAAIEAYDSEDELPSELRLIAPDKLGYVIIRGLAAQPGGRDTATTRLNALACGLEASLPG